MVSNLIIEICCSDIHSVQLAEDYKADAIELCVDLAHGGLTPSFAMIQKAREIFSGEVAIFFRPRNGDFNYDSLEKEILIKDISHSLDLGIDAIVAGGLNDTGDLDIAFMQEIIDISMGTTLVFHRAIDVSRDPIHVLNQLIELQIDRILSSGAKVNAYDGIQNLSSWNQRLGDKIQFMAGGGIDHHNVKEILDKTGIKRFHASLRKNVQSPNTIFNLGKNESADEEKMKKMMEVLGRI